MHQTRIFTIFLLMLLLLSACAPAQDVQPIEPKAPAVSEPTLEVSEPQESDSTSADVAQNNATDSIVQQKSNEENDTASEHTQEDEIVSSDKNYIQVQHYEKMLDLSLIPEETMSYEAYFSEIRQEQGGMDLKYFQVSLGRDIAEEDFQWLPELDDEALYIYRASRGMWLPKRMLEIWEIPGCKNAQPCGYTSRRIYCWPPRSNQLLQIDPEHGIVKSVYQSAGTLRSLVAGTNIVVFSELISDGTWRIIRLYEPDGSTDVLVDNLRTSAGVRIYNNCAFDITCRNPEMTRLREEHKGDYWSEYWTSLDEKSRASSMELYKNVNPDYVDDGGVPPYDESLISEDLLGGCSGDVVEKWVWEHYGVPDEIEYYCDTLTGYHKLMYYSFYGFQYFFPDGTPWEEQRVAYGTGSNFEGLEFWRFLPSDD